MRLYQRGKKGIWYLDTTVAGRRIERSSGTTDKRQAEEWAAKITHDTWRTSRLGDSPSVTWGQAVLEWLRKHQGERKSIEDMKDRLRWLTEHLEDVTLDKITRKRVELLMAERTCSDATRNRFVAEVSKILNYAHSVGWLASVPKFRRYKENPRFRWLTQTEAATLLGQLPAHLRDMAEFSLATGLRESNVRLLQWERVDLQRALAWVEAGDTKSGRALSVPLNEQALEVLARRTNIHPSYVFTFKGPRVMDEHSPVWNCSSHAWYKAVNRAGLKGLRWHDLRHTWASWHVMAGTPLPVLQVLGGWSSLTMVLRYAHVGRDHAAAYANNSLRDKSATSAPFVSEDYQGNAADIGVADGTRTHDDRNHNPGLYQLSYSHHGTAR